MIKHIIYIICFFYWLNGYSQSEKESNYILEKGEVSFISDAPLEFISASSNQLKGLLDPRKKTFAFQLPIQSLKGFNSALQQEHFYENYLEAEKYPYAIFSGKIIEKVDFSIYGTQNIRAKGEIDIHGKKQDRIISCTLIVSEEGVQVVSVFTVHLDDHAIVVPRLVYQKIAEDIEVKVNVFFVISKDYKP